MSLNEVFEVQGDVSMENELIQDEFTFKKVWELLKASFVRGVVFCLVAAISMGIVSAIVLTTTRRTRETVSTTILYSHSGIENGKAPDGTNLYVNKIKSPYIVSLAIEEYNKNVVDKKDEIDFDKMSSIIANIDITGHLPQDILDQIEFQMSLGDAADTTVLKYLWSVFPSQYTISISNFKAAGITIKQAIPLLDEIVKQYIADFKETYGSPALLESFAAPLLNKGENVASYEYIELYSVFEENIRKAINYLNTHASMNGLFRSQTTGKTFSDIRDELRVLESTRLFQLETLVMQNGLANDPDYTLEYFLTTRRRYVQYQQNAEENAQAIYELIEKYENGEIVLSVDQNGNPIKVQGGPTAMYDSLFSQYTSYTNQAITYSSYISLLDQRLDYFADLVGEEWVAVISPNNTAENRKIADEFSAAFATEINNLFQLANLTAEDYYDVEYMKNAINITLPAAHLTQDISMLKIMLVISVAVVFLAGVAAIITTHTVLTRKKIQLEREIAENMQ